MYKNNDSLHKVREGNGCFKNCEIWNIGYWYLYINSFLKSQKGRGGGGGKALLFCDPVKMSH